VIATTTSGPWRNLKVGDRRANTLESWSERPPNPVGGLATANSRTVKHEEIFYEKKWNFLEGNCHTAFTIKPNNYEYPFQQILDGGEFPVNYYKGGTDEGRPSGVCGGSGERTYHLQAES